MIGVTLSGLALATISMLVYFWRIQKKLAPAKPEVRIPSDDRPLEDGFHIFRNRVEMIEGKDFDTDPQGELRLLVNLDKKDLIQVVTIHTIRDVEEIPFEERSRFEREDPL